MLPSIPQIPISIPSLTRNPPSTTHQPPLSPKPTIILVPGGWQSPTIFSLILPALERFGYSVIPINLPSTTTVPAVSSFAPDVDAVRNAVTSCLAVGKDVVMIMHSYGGLVGCEALKEMDMEEVEKRQKEGAIEVSAAATADGGTLRRGRVLRLGFIAGLVFPIGRSTLSPTFAANKKVNGFTCVDDLISVTDGAKRFFNDLPPDEGELWAGRLRKHSRLFRLHLPLNPPRLRPPPILLPPLHPRQRHSPPPTAADGHGGGHHGSDGRGERALSA
ncbi:MAG: hypothetical protein Q9212_006487, partial [Teloschistes hypoglaucus]